jgi:hypothetical protein
MIQELEKSDVDFESTTLDALKARAQHQEEGMTYPKLLKVSFTHNYSIYWDFPFYEPSLPLDTCRMWTVHQANYQKRTKKERWGYPDNHYLLRSNPHNLGILFVAHLN